MIIQPNSLADDLRGVSRYEKIAFISIFIMGIMIIKTDDVYGDCEKQFEFQGIFWELGLLPLTFLGDITKSYQVCLFIAVTTQSLTCQVRLQFTIIYLLYKILGQRKMIYSLFYLLPLLLNTYLPYQKFIFAFVQFVLALLILMLNRQMMPQNKQKSNSDLKYYISRLLPCLIMMKHLDVVNSSFFQDQVIVMILFLPLVYFMSQVISDSVFGGLFLIFYYLPEQYLMLKLILQCFLVCFVTTKLLPFIMDQKFAMTVSLMLPIVIMTFEIPEWAFLFLLLFFINEPPSSLYEQIQL